MRLRGRRSGKGQALVEFALILPVFLLLLFGLFDLGRAVYAWSTINNAAREAARRLIVDQTWALESGRTVFTHARDIALDRSVSLGVQSSEVHIDFRDPDILDSPDSCENVRNPADVRLGCIAAVGIDYPFVPATPVLGNIIGSFTLHGESRFAVEAICQEDGVTVTQCPPGD